MNFWIVILTVWIILLIDVFIIYFLSKIFSLEVDIWNCVWIWVFLAVINLFSLLWIVNVIILSFIKMVWVWLWLMEKTDYSFFKAFIITLIIDLVYIGIFLLVS